MNPGGKFDYAPVDPIRIIIIASRTTSGAFIMDWCCDYWYSSCIWRCRVERTLLRGADLTRGMHGKHDIKLSAIVRFVIILFECLVVVANVVAVFDCSSGTRRSSSSDEKGATYLGFWSSDEIFLGFDLCSQKIFRIHHLHFVCSCNVLGSVSIGIFFVSPSCIGDYTRDKNSNTSNISRYFQGCLIA